MQSQLLTDNKSQLNHSKHQQHSNITITTSLTYL